MRAADPALSDEANARLTEELREAVGRDRVAVPADTPRHSRRPHDVRPGFVDELIRNRVAIGLTFLVLMVVAGTITFATGSVWVLPVAILLHAVGTFVVAGGALQLTTEVEHASPQTAARLEQEGVSDPDALLTSMAEEFTASSDSAGEAASQRTEITPSARPTAPSGGRPVLRILPIGVVLGAVLVSGIAPLVAGGGLLWIVPALVWPSAIVWGLIVARAPSDTA